jgi:hypothetical protein
MMKMIVDVLLVVVANVGWMVVNVVLILVIYVLVMKMVEKFEEQV